MQQECATVEEVSEVLANNNVLKNDWNVKYTLKSNLNNFPDFEWLDNNYYNDDECDYRYALKSKFDNLKAMIAELKPNYPW